MRTIALEQDVDAQVLGLWKQEYVQYAWLGCLAYTTDRARVAEMLTYVLVVAHLITEMFQIPKASPQRHDDILEVIDVMLEVVGPDYHSGLIHHSDN